MNRRFAITGFCLLITGCGPVKETTDEPRLGTLTTQPVRLEQSQVQPVNLSEMKQNYRELLKLVPDPDKRAEFTRRLADLELQDAENQLLQGAQTPPAELDTCIDLYESLLALNGAYAKRDQVLYQLSRAYEMQGDAKRNLAVLDELVTAYPASPSWPEAQFRRAEQLFADKRFDEARQAYASLIELSPPTGFHDRALHKHGWSCFKEGDYEAALDSFFTLLDGLLIEDASRDENLLPPADRKLAQETLRILALTLAELGGGEQIDQALHQHGDKPYALRIYQALSSLYQEQKRYLDAAQTLESFVEHYPTNPASPPLAEQAIQLYLANDLPQQALAAKQRFTERYAKGAPAWQGLPPDGQTWVETRSEGYIRELAAQQHALTQQALKRKDPQTKEQGELAAAWYLRYLNEFPQQPQTGEMRFLYGELLSDLQRYADAIAAYEQSAYQDPSHAKQAEAGYAAVQAYTARIKELQGPEREALQRSAADSVQRFAETFPQDPHRAEVLQFAADTLFALQDNAAAQRVALLIPQASARLTPAQQQAAWTIAAHAEFAQQDYAAAEQHYAKALELMPAQAKERDELAQRLAAAIYKQGEGARDRGDNGLAAQHFLRVPEGAYRDIAEYDAAACLIAAQQWEEAIRVLEGFRSHFPADKRLAEADHKLAFAYVQAMQPAAAAGVFARIAAGSEPEDVRREAGWRAAELYQQAGEKTQAVTAYEAYLKAFPQPLAAQFEALNQLSLLHAELGQTQQRDERLRQLIQADAKAGAERTDRMRYLAAGAALQLAQAPAERFREIRLSAPLKRNLKLKKEQMELAISAYQQATDYGVAEIATQANFHLGELYQQLTRDLLDSERPAKLNGEELEQYEVLLEEQAYPFEEQAIAYHERNARLAPEGIYDEWVQRSYSALAQLLPVRYAKQERNEQIPEPKPEPEPEPDQAQQPPPAPAAKDATEASQEEAQAEQNRQQALAEQQHGIELRRQGKFQEALAAYRQALMLQPDYALAHLNLAILLDLYLAQPEEALSHYRRFQELSPTPDEQVAAWITELERRLQRSKQP